MGAQLRARVVGLQHLDAQRLATDAPVAVPRADVVAEGLNDVPEDLDRDVARLEGSLQGGPVRARAREKHVSFDPARQARRHRVLHPEVLIGVALECGASHLAIGIGHQSRDGALRHLMQLTVRADRRREFQVGVGEHAVHGQGRGQRI